MSKKGLAALPPVSVPLEDAGYGGSGGGSPGERHPRCQTIQEQALKPIHVIFLHHDYLSSDIK